MGEKVKKVKRKGCGEKEKRSGEREAALIHRDY